MQKKVSDLVGRLKSGRQESLDELVQSIRQVGMIEPVVVDSGGHIISGRRRVAAAKKAGISLVPVVVSERDGIENRIAELDANLMVLPLGSAEFDRQLEERKRLDERVHGKRGKFAEKTAKRLGVSKRTVEKAVTRAKKGLGELSKSKADQLSRLKQPARMAKFAEDHSYKEVKDKVDAMLGKRPKLVDPMDAVHEHVDKLETLLRDMIAGRVDYVYRNGKFEKSLHGLSRLIEHFIRMHKDEHKARKLRAA